MQRRFIISAALAAALTLPSLAYAATQDPASGQGQGGTGTGAAGSNFDKTHHKAMDGAGTKHTMNHMAAPASGGSAGSPGGGGCDPAATTSSASAPVGQAAPGCK